MALRWWMVLIVVTIGLCYSIRTLQSETPDSYVPPTTAQRNAAVGDLQKVSPQDRPYFLPGEKTTPLGEPRPGDWLAAHPESQQPFDLFVKQQPNRLDSDRKTIYLLPLNEFDEFAPKLETLREFLQVYFAMLCRVLPQATLPAGQIRERINSHTKQKQWLSTDILMELQPLVPADAYCLLAVTSTDLYPDEKWNFVFGQATLAQRVGVYSFARFDPHFWGRERTPAEQTRMLRRTCQLIAHETGHMFGISHCVYYRCVMNGSNSQTESDAKPLHACPVCLRKLHWSIGFNPVEREKQLQEVYRQLGIEELVERVE